MKEIFIKSLGKSVAISQNRFKSLVEDLESNWKISMLQNQKTKKLVNRIKKLKTKKAAILSNCLREWTNK